MPEYSKSKIYKIVCNITGLIYIGSTSQTLCQRLQEHKRCYKKFLNEKYNYTTSFKIIENNNYDIILLEDFPCERKEQLHARERFWIENTECVNKQIPTRTDKEYREDNKQKIAQQKKEWNEENKEYHKEYCLRNKKIINQYQNQYQREYREKKQRED